MDEWITGTIIETGYLQDGDDALSFKRLTFVDKGETMITGDNSEVEPPCLQIEVLDPLSAHEHEGERILGMKAYKTLKLNKEQADFFRTYIKIERN